MICIRFTSNQDPDLIEIELFRKNYANDLEKYHSRNETSYSAGNSAKALYVLDKFNYDRDLKM